MWSIIGQTRFTENDEVTRSNVTKEKNVILWNLTCSKTYCQLTGESR